MVKITTTVESRVICSVFWFLCSDLCESTDLIRRYQPETVLVKESVKLLRRFLGKTSRSKEMNEEFEFITITISLAASAKRKQLSNCHRQTSFQCSHAKHVTSRIILPRVFGRREEIPWGGGGGYLRNFWVGMCHWDPGTRNLYQSYCSSAEFCYRILE